MALGKSCFSPYFFLPCLSSDTAYGSHFWYFFVGIDRVDFPEPSFFPQAHGSKGVEVKIAYLCTTRLYARECYEGLYVHYL